MRQRASGPRGRRGKRSSRLGVPRVRIALDIAVLARSRGWAVYSAYDSEAFHGWRAVLPPLGLLCCAAAVLGFHRDDPRQPAAALARTARRLLAAVGAAAYAAGAAVPAIVLWISVSVMAMERLPLVAGLGTVGGDGRSASR